MSTRDNLAATWQEGKTEFQEGDVAQKIALGSLACTLFFEWGPLYESVLAGVEKHVLDTTHNVLLTTAATTGTTIAEQTAFGVIAAIGIQKFPRFMDSMRNRFFNENEVSSTLSEQVEDGDYVVVPETIDQPEPVLASKHRAGNVYGRFITAFTLGTAATTLARNASEEHSFKENVLRATEDAGLIGGGVAVLAAGVALIPEAGHALGHETFADRAVTVLTSPLLYFSLFGVQMYWNHRQKKAETLATQTG